MKISEIDSDRYDNLLKSRKVLSGALALEEKFDLLVSNYLDLESECLNCALKRVTHNEQSYEFNSKAMLTINRRTVNLLTSARLYLDHLPQNVKFCVSDNKFINTFKSRQHDNSFSYRFMEALRNYVQHCGLGIHLITTGSKILSSKKEGEVEFSFSAFSCKRNLQESGNFKKTVLDEMPDNVNIIAASRSYIDGIRSIHSNVREIIQDAVSSARSEIKKSIDAYTILNGESCEPLKIAKFERHENLAKTIEEHYLLLDWDNHRVKLYEKNRSNSVTSSTDVENWYIRSV